MIYHTYNQGQTISFIYYFILFKCRKSPHPPNQSEVKKRLEGPKFNIEFGGKGLGWTGEGDKYIHYAKRGHFMEVCQHFCPSLSECKIVLLHTS